MYQGLIRKFDIFKLNILIIAECWPSIVVGLEEDSSRKIWIYSKRIPPSLKNLFPSQVSWIGESEVARLANENNMDSTIIQGTGAFCEHVLWSFGQSLSKDKLLFILPAERLRIFKRLRERVVKWYKIRHDEIGGVTNSKWLIGVGKSNKNITFPPITELCATVGMKRHFIDILKTVTFL